MHVICYPDLPRWRDGAAREIARRLDDAIRERGRATLMLAGGSTPRPIYETLAELNGVDWARIEIFWGDERHVAPDDRRSNFRMARESLLAPLDLDPVSARVHPVPTGDQPATDAVRYERLMRDRFRIGPTAIPRFDVVLLGMGDDGHTASLFPGSPGLEEVERLVIHNPAATPEPRLTVTYPLLDQARSLIVLVRGGDKAERLREVLTEPQHDYPIQRIAPHKGELLWLVDREAAARLPAGLCSDPTN